jgi:hypothetical protein
VVDAHIDMAFAVLVMPESIVKIAFAENTPAAVASATTNISNIL